jgi:hypothetical protein
MRQRGPAHRTHEVFCVHLDQRRILRVLEVDQVERDIQRARRFHDLIGVRIHGLLIERVHFGRFGLSARRSNLIGDLAGVLQTSRGQEHFGASLRQAAPHRSTQ